MKNIEGDIFNNPIERNEDQEEIFEELRDFQVKINSKEKIRFENLKKIKRLAPLISTALVIFWGPKIKEEWGSLIQEFDTNLTMVENEDLTKTDELIRSLGKDNIKNIGFASLINKSDLIKPRTEKQSYFFKNSFLDSDSGKKLDDFLNPNNENLPKEIMDEFIGIKFIDGEEKMPSKYGKKLSDSNVAGYVINDGFMIYLYKKSNIDETQKNDKLVISKQLFGTLFHEIMHCNDWIRDSKMSTEERLNLLTSILERIKSEDRYKSSYVEAIESPYGDKDTLYIRCVEYFAEIGEEYFLNPRKFEEQNPVDFKIIDEFVKNKSPNFDVYKLNDQMESNFNNEFKDFDYSNFEYDYSSDGYDYSYDYEDTYDEYIENGENGKN